MVTLDLFLIKALEADSIVTWIACPEFGVFFVPTLVADQSGLLFLAVVSVRAPWNIFIETLATLQA
jgi:hypothetical protein